MRSKRALFVIDAVILALLAAGLFVELTGGFYSEPFGMRVSARRPERPLLTALVIGFIRWRWLRSGEFFGRPVEFWRRLFDRTADSLPVVVSSRWHNIAVFAGLVGIAGVMLNEQIRDMTGVPDLGDPLFSMWRMGWVYQQLLGDPRALFDANIFHPTPLTLTLSDSMLLPSFFAAPLFALGIHPLFIYNGLLLASFPLNGFATYLLIKRLTGSVPASFAGAVFYMCHPYRLEHYSHFELQMTMWMPLALLAVLRFGESQRLRYALAAAVCAAAQLYSSMYYGVYFPFFALVVVVVLGVASRWRWRPMLRPAAIAAALALALAVPLARPYVAAQAMKGDRDEAAVEFYSADLSDYFRPHPRLATHSGKWFEDSHPERALFPGVTPLALTAVALVPPLGPIRAAFTAGLALSYDMSRGMKGVIYPTLYRTLPPIRGMRVPARFSIILGISLAVLSAFGVRRLLSRWPGGWRRRLAFAGIIGLMAFDLRPSLMLYPTWVDVPRIYQDLAGRSDVVLAEFPFEQNEPMVTNELPFMYFSLWHWHEMVNGYSGFTPESHKALIEPCEGLSGCRVDCGAAHARRDPCDGQLPLHQGSLQGVHGRDRRAAGVQAHSHRALAGTADEVVRVRAVGPCLCSKFELRSSQFALLVENSRGSEQLIRRRQQHPPQSRRIVGRQRLDELPNFGRGLRRLVTRQRGVRPAFGEKDVARLLNLADESKSVTYESFR